MEVVLRAAPTCQPGNTTNHVPVDVVRPDDNAFTNPLLKNCSKAGERVGSEVSSEVVPVATDLPVDVTPGRAA
jgi:hypothetical protein